MPSKAITIKKLACLSHFSPAIQSRPPFRTGVLCIYIFSSVNYTSYLLVEYLDGPVLVVEAREGAVGGGDHHCGVRGEGQYRHSAQVVPIEPCPTQRFIPFS